MNNTLSLTKLRNHLTTLLAPVRGRAFAVTGGAVLSRGGEARVARCSAPISLPCEEMRAKQAGFTLIEMMIVVAIIGLIMGMVGLNVMRKFDEARVDTTKNQIRQLGLILNDFKRVCGNYPTTEQGLDALIHKENAANCKNWEPFIQNGKLPQDAWGHDFLYQVAQDNFEIKSLGSDGKEGGDGTSKDITSSDL